jgi:thiosulfate dehydrogenase
MDMVSMISGRAARLLGLLALAGVAGCQISDRSPASSSRGVQQSGSQLSEPVPFRVPSEYEIADADVLRSLRRGRAILRLTRDSLPANVGNRLACVSCHALDGTQKDALPLVGAYSRFPQYRARSGHVDLIEDRVNDCFERSMNGRALDRSGADMRDVVTYLAFLSRGVPAGARVDGQGVPALDAMAGDTTSGARLFAATCVSCHGPQGQGTSIAPPLWGPHSYNIGAGMTRIRTAAAFIRSAMPQNKPGSLTSQEAFDLAAYVNSRPRPDFARTSSDWPRGDPPPDVAYPTSAATRKKSG